MSDRWDDHDLDPVFLHSRRETKVLLITFFIFLVWVVGVSWWLGYETDPAAPLQMVWGMPRWVVWGVAVPWLGANLFTLWFCWRCVADDPLGEVQEESADLTSREDATL